MGVLCTITVTVKLSDFIIILYILLYTDYICNCEIFFHVPVGAAQADEGNVVPYSRGEIQLDRV